jgi:WD40 repeat protein
MTRDPPTIKTSLVAHTSFATSVAFSPDGQTLASKSADGTVILWDMTSDPPARKTTLVDHTSTLILFAIHTSVTFSPDGQTLASAFFDDMVMLWDVNVEHWIAHVCHMVNRNLSYDEWRQYMGNDRPYEKTCPNPPIGEGVLEHGDELARQGDHDEAIAWYEYLNSIDDTLDLDPQARAAEAVGEQAEDEQR